MRYTEVKNLRYANKEHSLFDCDVTFEGIGTVPYTPHPNDPVEHSREIYARCMAGEFGDIADYILAPDEGPQEPTIIPVTPATSCTPLQYVERFTDTEQLAIVTATMNNAAVKLWYDKLMAASEVVFADPRLSSGMDALVAAGLITQARSEEILPLNVRSTGVQSL